MPGENPFRFLEQLPPQEIADRLAGEMAFVQGAALCRMSPVASAKVMACMDDDRRREVAAAMSKSRQMPSDVLADIADELQRKSPRGTPAGGASGGAIPAKPALGGLAKLKNLQLRPLAGFQSDAASASSGQSSGGPTSGGVTSGVRPVEATIRPPEPKFTGLPGARREPPASADAPAPERRRQAIDDILTRVRDKKTARPPLAPSARSSSPAAPNRGAARPAGGKAAAKAQRIDGMALAAHILREAGSTVLNNVKHELPDLYQRLHNRMFDFSDLERSTPQTLGAVFTGVDLQDGALALRFASDGLRERVFNAVSPRRAELLREEMAADKSRVKLAAIDEAQQAVIQYALQLQDSGRLLIDPTDPDLA